MKHLLSSLRGWSVTSHRTGEHFGSIDDAVLDPSNGKLIALRVRLGFLFIRRRYLAPCDIQRWGDAEAFVEDASSLIRPEEEPRLGTAIRSCFPWIGLPVRTPTGRRIGTVKDVLLEVDLGSVISITVEDRFLGIMHLDERRIAANHILDVTSDGVVVEDVALRRVATKAGRSVRQFLSPLPVRGPYDSPSLPVRAR